jgi:hypothetical protein
VDDVIELTGGRTLRPGAIVTIRGTRGRYEYRRRAGHDSITCWGGAVGKGAWRTFTVDRITSITYPTAAEQRSLFDLDFE